MANGVPVVTPFLFLHHECRTEVEAQTGTTKQRHNPFKLRTHNSHFVPFHTRSLTQTSSFTPNNSSRIHHNSYMEPFTWPRFHNIFVLSINKIINHQATPMKKILFLALLAGTAAISSYTIINTKKPHVSKGPEVQVHGGKAWAWIQVSKQGNPEKLGITLTGDVLNTVPGPTNDGGHGHMPGNHWVMQLPSKAGSTPFNHVSMHWNPNGHEPENIYTLPHFDFHFYTTTPEEVLEIGTYEQDSVRFKNTPSAEYYPAQYVNPGAATSVPQMGAHYVDVTSGEFQGKTFTETFIFGSFDGKMTFYEPMITLDFLKKSNDFVRDIPQSAKVQKTGWYPTKMRVKKNDGNTEIVLEQFVYRKQS